MLQNKKDSFLWTVIPFIPLLLTYLRYEYYNINTRNFIYKYLSKLNTIGRKTVKKKVGKSYAE